VLYDRQLVDDELYDLWQDFKAGVRILVLSDSCHSGSVTKDIPAFITGGPRIKAMPSILGEKVESAHKALYHSIQDEHLGSETANILASVLLISGCQDFQVSRDGERNGAFTGMLKRVWAGGKIEGDYKHFHDLIAAKMPPDQTPNYFFVGASNPVFEAQKPFTI
jgi:metacaspase-1